MRTPRLFTHRLRAVAAMTVAVGAALVTAGISDANPVSAPGAGGAECPTGAIVDGYSDALDKVKMSDEVVIGGLSALDFDRRANAYVTPVDNDDSEPSRLWFFRDLGSPELLPDPLVLKNADGVPYTGETGDFEGIAMLPNGSYLISSELEPSIRIFGRDGVQRAELPVPDRFAVTPDGEAGANATLEGLTVSRDGRQVVAAMEGALSGDSNAVDHRLLVFRWRDDAYRLVKQVGYRTDEGLRIPEVAFYGRDRLLIMEGSWSPLSGNQIKLYATDLAGATDISAVGDLATEPDALVGKTLVADVTECPDLGAEAKQPQTNPLLDNYEAVDVKRTGKDEYAITLLSDDNFNPTQITRVLRLTAQLP